MRAFISMETFLLCSFSFIILITFFYFKRNFIHFEIKKSFPPSPRKIPIIGNLHQLGLSPHRSLQVLSQKHGPIMLIHLGSLPMLVVSSAETAREILKTHDLSFCSRPSLTIANIVLYNSMGIAFSPYGEYWRQLKSIVVVQLLCNARVNSFRKVREEEMSFMIDMLTECCGSSTDLSKLIVSLSNNIICRVAFGKTYSGTKFTSLLRQLVDVLGVFSVGNYVPWLSWVDRLSGLEGRARNIAKEFDEYIERIVEEHVQKEKIGETKSDEVQDLVDILLNIQRETTTRFKFNRDTLKAVILDIFGGGTDTTFTTLEWAISELIKNPMVMKKLHEEVKEIAQGRSMILEADLEKMEYLKAVIKETLRLHAPFPLLLPRESIKDVRIMGYDIPERTQVIINAWAIGRDPVLWEEPEEFRPERFLKNSIDYKGLNFEWLPFGGGRRQCPGIQFGVAIIELVLSNIIYKFDLGLPNGAKLEDLDMSEICGITVHRKSPLLVAVSAR